MNCKHPVKILLHVSRNKNPWTNFQVSFLWNFSYRKIRKYNVLKSVISKDGVKVLKTIPCREAMKKLNWENETMFGKLIRPKNTKNNLFRRRIRERLCDVELGKEPSENYFFMMLQDITEEELWLSELPFLVPDFSPFSDYDSGKLLDFPISNTWRNGSSPKLEVDSAVLETNENPGGSELPFPSVTRILQATMSHESTKLLQKWKEKMIAEMGKEKFEEYHKRIFSQGSAFHNCVEKYLLDPDAEFSVPKEVSGFWESCQDILPNFDNVQHIECPVKHPFLHYKGIFDCIADYRGTTSLIEWKTSQKPKTTLKDLYDSPLQVAAYIGAVNFDRRYDVQINQGVIVVANENGFPGHVHVLSKNHIGSLWKQWLQRLSMYWKMTGKHKN